MNSFLAAGLFFAVFAGCLFATIPSMAGGPWMQGKGNGYAQIGFSYIKSNQLFNRYEPDMPWQLEHDVTDITLQLSMEYGLLPRMDLLLALPFKFVSTGTESYPFDERRIVQDSFPSASKSAPGNMQLGFRYSLIRARWTLAGKLFIELPVNNLNETTGLTTGFPAWRVKPVVSLGYSGFPFYFIGETGLLLQSNSYSSMFLLSGETGYGFFKGKSYLVIAVDLQKSFYNGQDLTFTDPETGLPYDPIKNGLYLNDQEYFSFGMKWNQTLHRNWLVSIGYYGAFYGNLVAYSPSYNVGVAYNWQRKLPARRS